MIALEVCSTLCCSSNQHIPNANQCIPSNDNNRVDCVPDRLDLLENPVKEHPPRLVEDIILDLELITRTCFLDIINKSIVNQFFDPEKRQLFITGTSRGLSKPIIEIVTVLRQTNPDLICIGFAIEKLPIPPFHASVEKLVSGSTENLKKTIQKLWLDQVEK